jgi:hypothetical protein
MIGEAVLQSGNRHVQSLVGSPARYDRQHHARSPFEKIVEVEKALALSGAAIAEGEQAAESPIGGTIGRPGENVGRIITKDEAAADGIGKADFFRHDMAADDSGKSIAIGHRDAGKSHLCRLSDEFFRMRSAAQKREIGGDREFGEWDHAKTPCRYQRGVAVSRP